MSRQSDIQALAHLRDQITETGFMIQMSQKEVEKYEACEQELTTSHFVFEPLPTDGAEQATARYRAAWIQKYADTKPYKKRVSIVFTVLTAVLAVLFLLDMILMSGIVYDVGEMQKINSGFWNELGWFAYLIQVLFSVFVILLPWFFFSDSLQSVFWEQPLGILGGSVVLLLLFWYVSVALSGGYIPLIAFAVAMLLPMLARGITGAICGIKRRLPRLNAEQKAAVAAARQQDEQNALQNVDKEKQDRAAWETRWETRKRELVEQMDVHMKVARSALDKAQALQQQVEESDVLGANEKHVETINWLIYFLEGHRADSIKEALQQYDVMQHNEKMLALEREKNAIEAQRVRQEHEDRRRAMEQERYHQMQMQAQAQRAADMQSQIAYNTAQAAQAADRMRREAASVAAATADFQARMASEATWQRLNDYYNS